MAQTNEIQKRKLLMKTKKFLILEDFLKNDHNVKISELENKIPNVSSLVKKKQIMT